MKLREYLFALLCTLAIIYALYAHERPCKCESILPTKVDALEMKIDGIALKLDYITRQVDHAADNHDQTVRENVVLRQEVADQANQLKVFDQWVSEQGS